jgi:hypothetical protein
MMVIFASRQEGVSRPRALATDSQTFSLLGTSGGELELVAVHQYDGRPGHERSNIFKCAHVLDTKYL